MDAWLAVLPDLWFRNAVLLFPIATVLHVIEQWPRLPGHVFQRW